MYHSCIYVLLLVLGYGQLYFKHACARALAESLRFPVSPKGSHDGRKPLSPSLLFTLFCVSTDSSHLAQLIMFTKL